METTNYFNSSELVELNSQELENITGGGFWYDLGYAAGRLYHEIKSLFE
jgi:DNA integrity scanning protein DisA with diadenylate cyclase activity